jgi:hypothetical protein
MDLAGLTRLPEPDFVARIQAGQPLLGPLDLDNLPSDYVDVEVTVTRRPLKDRASVVIALRVRLEFIGGVIEVTQLPQHRDKGVEASLVTATDLPIDKDGSRARIIAHGADLELVLGWLVGFEPEVAEPGESLGHWVNGSFGHGVAW